MRKDFTAVSFVLLTAAALVAYGCGGTETTTTAGPATTGGPTTGTGGTSAGGASGTGTGTGTGTGSGGSTSSQGGGGSGAGVGGGGAAPDCVDNSDCDDGISCTIDLCNAGTCSNTTDDTVCNNGDYCDGDETCDPTDGTADPTTGCVGGLDPCDDGFACTNDSCDDTTDTCTNTADDANCSDGTFCNGAETCNPADGSADAAGCVIPAADPCDGGPIRWTTASRAPTTCATRPATPATSR
jgi:hypothetical protein